MFSPDQWHLIFASKLLYVLFTGKQLDILPYECSLPYLCRMCPTVCLVSRPTATHLCQQAAQGEEGGCPDTTPCPPISPSPESSLKRGVGRSTPAVPHLCWQAARGKEGHMSSPDQQRLIFPGRQLEGGMSRRDRMSSPDQQHLTFAGKQLEERSGEKHASMAVCPYLCWQAARGKEGPRSTVPHFRRQAARGEEGGVFRHDCMVA